MPIYEFHCSSCNSVVEVIQKVSDPIPETCPSCNAEGTLSKLISKSSFVLKGTGWYETDFKDKARSGKAGTDTSTHVDKNDSKETTTETSTTAESSDSKKTESKPASKPESVKPKATGTDGK